MTDLRVEKRRAQAALTLSTGSVVRGSFFVAEAGPLHAPERVLDLLNAEPGFFPFELHTDAGGHTVLYSRSQLVSAVLTGRQTNEVELDPGYSVATSRRVRMLLSTGAVVEGRVRIYRPSGQERLSDYARAPQMFRYLETPLRIVIINVAHVVELREATEV